jgi:hypothetical protein
MFYARKIILFEISGIMIKLSVFLMKLLGAGVLLGGMYWYREPIVTTNLTIVRSYIFPSAVSVSNFRLCIKNGVGHNRRTL